MSPYATATLENLRGKRNRSPDETALLITLLAQATADATRPTASGEQRPPVPTTLPVDEPDEDAWEIRACHTHAF